MTCQTCKFARKSAHQLSSYECWRYPPAVYPVQSGNGVGAVTMCPVMPAHGWCGEYQPAVVSAPQGVAAKMDA